MMLLTSVLLLYGALASDEWEVPCIIRGSDARPYKQINATEDLVLPCESIEPVRWIYPRQQAQESKNYSWYGWGLPPGQEYRAIKADKNGRYISVLKVPSVIQNDTGVYKCVSQANDSVTISEYFYYVLGDQLLISGRTSVYGYKDSPLNFPCRPAHPDVEVQLFSVYINITEDNIFCDPRSGFTMKKAMVPIRSRAKFTCIARNIKNNSTQTAKLGVIIRSAVTKRATSAIIHEAYFYPNVSEGSNVTLNCTSRYAFNIHWYKQPGWIKLEEDSKLWNSTIPEMLYKLYDVKKNDSGIYECVAYNGTHGLSTNVTLKVFGKNEHFLELYLKEPKILSMCIEEGDFELIVNISSSDVPHLQWSHKDSPINKTIFFTEQHTGWARIKKTNATNKDSGVYTLTASISHKNKSMHSFNVTVADKKKPKILDKPNGKFCLNKQYNLTCSSDAKWYFYSSENNNSYEIDLKPDNTISEGNILHFNATTQGTLICAVQNQCNFTYNDSITVRITDMPKIDETLQIWKELTEIVEGDNFKLTCGVSRDDYTNEINWRQPKGIKIEPRHDSSLYSHFATIELHNVVIGSSGNYTCEAVRLNGTTEIITEVVQVYGREAPRVQVSWKNTEEVIKRGDRYSLTCNAGGILTTSITWEKDDKTRINNGTEGILLHKNNTVLAFERFSEENEGLYKCIVKNRVGNVTSTSIKLSLQRKPLPLWLVSLTTICLIVLAVLSVILIRKRRKERRLKKELAMAGLANFVKGVPECINPDLPVDEQADLLPYEKKWEFPKEQLHIGKQLGAGAFGMVFKAEAEGIIPGEKSTTVAVKMAKSGLVDRSYIRALASELKIMAHLGQHLNVVNLLGACTKNLARRMELLVIVEFCCHGNLHDYLYKRRKSFIDQIDPQTGEVNLSIGKDKLTSTRSSNYSKKNELRRLFSRSASDATISPPSSPAPTSSSSSQEAGECDPMLLSNGSAEQPEWRVKYGADYQSEQSKHIPICTHDLLSWAFQVACGMNYLASRRVLHGDLALRNLLLAENGVVKICDFGLAKSMYKTNNYQKKSSGPLPIKWMAPESMSDHVFSTQSDAWSYGIVLWELFSLGQNPFPGMPADESLFLKLKNGFRMEMPECTPRPVYNIMLQCWNGNPRNRPSFSELAEKFELMLDDSLKRHFEELSTPYVQMNVQLIGDGNLLDKMIHPNYENLHIEDNASVDQGNENGHEISRNDDYIPMSASPRNPGLTDEVFEFPSKDINSSTTLKNNERNLKQNNILSNAGKNVNSEPKKSASNVYINLNTATFSNPNYTIRA